MGTIVSKKKKNRSQPQGPSGTSSNNNNNNNKTQVQANKPEPVIVNKQVTPIASEKVIPTTSENVTPATSEKVTPTTTSNQSVSNNPEKSEKPIRILTTAKPPSAKSNCTKNIPTGINTDDIELSYTEASKLQPETPDEMWKIVKKTSPDLPIDLKPTTSRKGWKTIRLFVSSTFKDFHQEREVLVKEVFPDLRLWCESRKLRLVECDLRWGVPKDSTTEDTIKICLSELDRCYEDNVAPFFLNLAGNRTGWIPTFNAMSLNLASQYGWVYGLTVTEMEIVHGAFRKLNPNALFLLRNVNGLENIPDEIRKDFFSEEPFHQEKLKTMKDMILDRFPESNVKNYSVESNYDAEAKRIDFQGLRGSDSEFSDVVYNFFQKRIEELYPLDLTPQNPLQVQKEAHEMFLDSRSATVLGRDKLLDQIEDYVINGNESKAPLLVVGIAGAGKSALMAKSAHQASELAKNNNIKNMPGLKNGAKCNIFFHFVGATPRSTDLASFLQRLTKEIKPDQKEVLSDLDSLVSLSYNLLENPLSHPILIFIDAINQMDEDKQPFLKRWLPEKLSENVRVVISTIETTTSHQAIRSFKTSPLEIICGPLDKDARRAIVENILQMYNKRLDDDQMKVLLDKVGSENPLWLTLACEELRVFGTFETLIDKIESLPDDLISLEMCVFERFENETGGELMKACVCMLEVSRHGLLETELLALLGEERNVKMPVFNDNTEDDEMARLNVNKNDNDNNQDINVEKNIEDTKQNISKLVQETYVKEDENDENTKKKLTFKRPKGRQVNFLPARDWAVIYRNLKPLLRPCGDLGEGRLDFYHRSLSKAVRKKYFKSENEAEQQHNYNFWHGVLADFFEGVQDMDRKAEELPYHLERLLDNNRLIRCLMDWEVFDRLYSEEFSIDLLHSWRQCGGYGVASAVYREQLSILRNSSSLPLIEYVEIVEKVYHFLIQAGRYVEALELMGERLEDELEQLGERPDEMADVYQNMARCKSEIDKAQQYLDPNQLEDNKQIVEYGRKCLMYREKLSGEENDYRCALANILISHHLSNVADITHRQQPRTEAVEAIQEAIRVFTKLNDIGHLAECKMTEAIIDFDVPFQQREKLLLDSLSLCVKGYGENHLLTTRILLNTGIAYEMVGKYDVSFDYFCRLKETCMTVFGPGHPKTNRAVNTLEEPRYKRMLASKKRTVPETA